MGLLLSWMRLTCMAFGVLEAHPVPSVLSNNNATPTRIGLSCRQRPLKHLFLKDLGIPLKELQRITFDK